MIIDRTHPPRAIRYRDPARSLDLRPLAPEDVDDALAAIQSSLPELRAYLPWVHGPVTREGQLRVFSEFLADWWAGRQFAAGLRDGAGAFVGAIGLHPRVPLNPNALEVGFWAATPHAGRGHVTLAARMMIVLAIDRFGCDRVQVLHDEANARSRAVVERCGFAFEGVVRNYVAPASEAMRAQACRLGPTQRLYAITPADLPRLDWVPLVRARTVLVASSGAEATLATPS